MYDTEREALYSQYQEASTRIALLSVRHMAAAVREAFPTAAHIVLSDSDQGDFLSTDVVLDEDGNELADSEGLEEVYEDSETAWNLNSGVASETWSDYVEQTGRRSGSYWLDIDKALTIQPADFAPKPPLVQIVHGRDPDEGCDHTVFVNDVRVEAEIEDIDPGRGYERNDWNERLEGYLNDTSNFGQHALGTLEAYADSQHISDEVPRLAINPPTPDEVYGWPTPAVGPRAHRPEMADRWLLSSDGKEWVAAAPCQGETTREDEMVQAVAIKNVPTAGVLRWMDHRGDEFTYTNETPEGT